MFVGKRHSTKQDSMSVVWGRNGEIEAGEGEEEEGTYTRTTSHRQNNMDHVS